VVQLIVFCAFIGMVLAVRAFPGAGRIGAACWRPVPASGWWRQRQRRSTAWSSAASMRMKRTAWRPTARGELSFPGLLFSALLCAAGAAILLLAVNALTLWLTLATFIGYAVIYTLVLKPLTPQNIVIGGASGAMPPVLGWAAMTGRSAMKPCCCSHHLSLDAAAFLGAGAVPCRGLPPRRPAHAAGHAWQCLHAAAGVSLYPGAVCRLSAAFCGGHERLFLPFCRVILGLGFCGYGWALLRNYSDALARKTFRFSLIHLSLLFAALLVDHYLT
jgi:protoheme IX farnesyltransferase